MNTKNHNVEQLDSNKNINSISDAPSVTIVNTIPVIEQMKTNTQEEATRIEYKEYRDELNSIYCTTTEENSVISEFVVDNDQCNHTLTIRQLNGSRNILLNREFDFNDQFKEDFLIDMIKDYNKYNSIFDSNVTIGQHDLVNFTVRTKENDTLIIKNIDMDLASKLNDILYAKKVETPSSKHLNETISNNDRGIGDTFVIILTILLIGLTLVGTIFFSIMSNK